MPPHVAPVVVSRIKVMARLDIAERRVPQDGRIGLTLGGKLLDVRVSTLPSRAGERVVLRILDKENAGIDLDVLGMTPAIERSCSATRWPSPTASSSSPGRPDRARRRRSTPRCGCSTTARRNILTVEDPVEYAIDGVGQTQVNPKVGLTFAAGLARDPAPGSRRRDGRRNPRPRDRRDRGAGVADRASRAVDRPHQRRGRRDHADARHEGRAVPARLDAARGDRAAAGAAAVPEHCRKAGAGVGDRSRRCSGIEPGTIVYEPVGLRALQRRPASRAGSACSRRCAIDETIRRLINDGGDETAIAAPRLRAQSPNLARGGARSWCATG